MDWLAEVDRVVSAVEGQSNITAAELNALLPNDVELTSRQIEDVLKALQEHGVSIVWEDA